MQSRDGSWSASIVVTAHVVRALATHGAPDSRALRRGVVWLLRQQLPDGSWPGLGGLAWADRPGGAGMGGPDAGEPDTGELSVTATVLPALLVAACCPASRPSGRPWTGC